MSETRTTRHHQTHCAIHGTLVNGKLRDCTCTVAATQPTPDRAAVREAVSIAKRYHADVSVDEADDYSPMHRAVGTLIAFTENALLRPAPLPADVQAAVRAVSGYLNHTEPARHDELKAVRDGTVDVRLRRSDLRTLLAHLTREAR